MQLLELAKAEALSLLNSLVMAGVFYGAYSLVAGGFSVTTYAKIALALFGLANVAFVLARWNKGSAWHAAKYVTEDD